MEPTSRLSRRLTTKDAVWIGLGSMIGAGIFAAAGPGAAAAGSGLLLAVLLAAGLAYLNATTMAQLASLYPESGGAYAYGRKRLGPYWGFLAGWGFVIGKTASCTAMALTFAHYAAPSLARPLALGAVAALTLVNYLGVKKTAATTRVLVVVVLASLLAVTAASLAGGAASVERLQGWTERGGIPGILQAAGMMFFAFAGYARIATLGEEVVDPERTIPRAMLVSLLLTLLVYLAVIATALSCVDADRLAGASAPLALAVESGRYAFLSPLVRFGACLASLGVLLSLLAGVSRTAFAMAAGGDLPRALAEVHPVHRVPHRAELTVGLVVAAVVSLADLRAAIGFSSFAVLTYYAIANAAAWTLPRDRRTAPRALAGLGLLGCLTVALGLPGTTVKAGLSLFALGSVYYALFAGRRPADPGPAPEPKKS